LVCNVLIERESHCNKLLLLLKRSLYRYRKSSFYLEKPKSLSELVIPESLKRTMAGKKFLRFDLEDRHRILLLATDQSLQVSVNMQLICNLLLVTHEQKF